MNEFDFRMKRRRMKRHNRIRRRRENYFTLAYVIATAIVCITLF